MASKQATEVSKNNTNYARFGQAAQELLPDLLRELILSKTPPNKLIPDCASITYLRSNLRPVEWFCINNVVNNGYSNFDVPLLYKLIRNLNIVPVPTRGWDFPRFPMANELTVGDDVERIRQKRNDIIHRGNADVPDVELSENFIIFKDISARLEGYLGKPNGYFVSKFEDLETHCMDQVTQQKCLHIMRELAKKDENLEDKVDNINAKLEEKNTQLEAQLKQYKQMIERELSEMKQTICDIHDPIPKHSKDLFEICISDWIEDEDKFVVTRATMHVLNTIQQGNCVVVTGCPGSGKSAILHHVALHLRTRMNYEIIPFVTDFSDLRQFYKRNSKQVFILEDTFGKVAVNIQTIEKWSTNLNIIENILKLGNTKLLLSCRLHILKDSLINRLKSLVSNQCNLHTEKFCLLKEERLLIAQNFLKEDEIECISGVLEKYAFFPLICRLFSANSNTNPKEFFENPVEAVKQNLLDMQLETNKTQYCAFTLCVLFVNLQEEWIENGTENGCIVQTVCEDLGLDLKLSRRNLRQQLHNLENTYIRKLDGSYRVIHDTIFDLAAVVCGQDMLECFINHADVVFIGDRYRMEYISADVEENLIVIPKTREQMYFKRLLKDLSKGNTYSTFQNRQLKFKIYRERLINFLCAEKDIVEQILRTFDELQIENIKCRQMMEMAENNSENSDSDDETLENPSRLEGSGDDLQFQPEMHGDISLPLLESSSQGLDDIVNILLDMGSNVNICDNAGRSALFMATLNGHIDTVKCLLEHLSDVSKCDKWERSPLYIACEEGHTKIAELLLKMGSDISKYDTCYFKTPLHVSCERGYTLIVKMLLEKYPTIYHCNSDGHTPLHNACKGGHTTVVKLLLDFGFGINQRDENGNTPLFVSCRNGHSDVVEVLLENNASISIYNTDGLSALHISCKWGHTAIVKRLLSVGKVNINSHDSLYGRTPLFLACEGKHEEITKYLIHIGCNIYQCNTRKQSPLYMACKTGQTSVVKLLLEKMTEYDVLSYNYSEWSPLIAACEAGYTCIVKLLVGRNLYVNIRNRDMQCPLHIACEQGLADMVHVLLTSECDINRLDGEGRSPLFISCEEGFSEIVKRLLESNADIHLRNVNGWSSFFIACCEGNADIVELLFQYKAEIWECDEETRRSPLFVACMQGHADVVEILLKNKADVNQCDIREWSPLHIASKEGHANVVHMLLQHGADKDLRNTGGRLAIDLARSSFRNSVVKMLQ